ncbi:hypothetical protein [Terracoccus luteus]|uniref:Uncharacterized protein n=1 Tax=Terracoccus luteus TaxID=53356 RepID=A0A839PW75_9MICO|nr:hypothetical protein [Terracoccus luteus]MBB2985042.1 hypothetical protein [Terracoccus luteus]MCP2170694.1 hypothetical protein [Terracoccus luteus]
MGLFDRRRAAALPRTVKDAVPLASGERVLSGVADDTTGGWVVATTYHLAFVSPDGELQWIRPWHEAEAGTWQADASLLTVTWVDRRVRPGQWRITEPTTLQQTLRERLQASVVTADEFRTPGRKTVRVVIRQDLGEGVLREQVVAPRGVEVTDPEVAAEVARRLARLRHEVGL